jgi:hypothetical protein
VNTIYLLPCPCGRKIPIQARQAGEIVTCQCGASTEVPTLLGLKCLEQAKLPSQPITPKTAWGAGHRLIFLGVLVLLFTIGMGIWLFRSRPTDPYANFTPEQMMRLAEECNPMQSWRLWHKLAIDGLEFHKGGAEITFADRQAQHRVFWWLLALGAGSGLTLVAAGIIVLNSKKKKPRETARG